MSQISNIYNIGILTITANNVKIFVGTDEIIILNDISVIGTTNFSIAIKNYSSSAIITNVKAYGSHNGIDFYIISDDLYPNNINPEQTEYSTFIALTNIMKITATSNSEDTLIDIYMQAAT